MRFTRYAAALTLAAVLLLFSTACNRSPKTSVVSEKPVASAELATARAEPRPSRFGLRARVSYADIEAIIAEQLPKRYPVIGERRVCKRVIGINACGTAQWNLNIVRTDDIDVSGKAQRVLFKAPLRFSGTVGMQGHVAKMLGLSSLDVRGALASDIRLTLDVQDNWCPVIGVQVDYRWLEKPTALWRDRVDIDLENIVNDALQRQLATLAPRLNEAIDCDRFREQLARYWRSYTFALDLPTPNETEASQTMHLNIVPTGFAFSGVHTEADKLGVSFEINGTTVVASTALQSESLSLPALRQVDFEVGRTDFDLLLRAKYAQLEEAINPLLNGRTFQSNSAAGQVTVQVNAIELSGNAAGVTVALDFTAQLPGSRRKTHGIVYLNALPVIDQQAQELRLESIRLSKVLDSTLWNVISTVFEGQIVAAIERGSVIDLASRTRELEARLLQQLQDPARTGGIRVNADNLSLRLLDIIPEKEALAARARVSAELDIDIPLTVLSRPLNRPPDGTSER